LNNKNESIVLTTDLEEILNEPFIQKIENTKTHGWLLFYSLLKLNEQFLIHVMNDIKQTKMQSKDIEMENI
jgi:hypothetical protein